MTPLTALNRKKSGVNGGEPEKQQRLIEKMAASTALSGIKAALAALNRRNSGGKGVEPEK